MSYEWFNIINTTEFSELGIPSRNLTLELGDRGEKEIMVTKGARIGVLIEEVFLSPNLNDENPFEFDGMAAYIDENDDLWVGYEVEE